MAKYRIEPDFRDLFDPLTEHEMENARTANAADPEHKRIPPIVLWKIDDKTKIVLDGHHTLKIRENLRINGKPPKIRFVEMEFADRNHAKAYAYSAQFARRNLTDSQRAMKAAEYAELLQICSASEPIKQGVSKSASVSEAAAAAGSSERSTWIADKVKEHGAKAIVEAVQQGNISVSDAESVVDLPKREQTAALRKVKGGEAKTLKAAAPKKKPRSKAGKPVFDYKKWEKKLGELIRLTDDHHKAYPDKKMLDVCLDSLGTYQADFQAWRRSKKA